jgi:hypothetical protein
VYWFQLIVRACIAALWLLVMCIAVNVLIILVGGMIGHPMVLTFTFTEFFFGALAGQLPSANEPFGPAKRALFRGQRLLITVPSRFAVLGVLAMCVVAVVWVAQIYQRAAGIIVDPYVPPVSVAFYFVVAAISMVARWRYLKHLT